MSEKTDFLKLLESNKIGVEEEIGGFDLHFSATSLDGLEKMEDNHFWHKNRKRLFSKLLSSSKKGSFDHLADIGCGNGSIVKYFQKGEQFKTVTGIDGYPQALLNARKRSENSILILKDINKLRELKPDNLYDVVVFADVLEHLDAPLNVLQQCFDLMQPGGVLLISVPASMALWSERDVFLGHRKRYGKRDLKDMVTKAGFDVVKCNYLFSHLFAPAYIGRKVLGKMSDKSGEEIEAEELKIVPGINGLLTFVGNLEVQISLHVPLPFGTSVYCMAQKA